MDKMPVKEGAATWGRGRGESMKVVEHIASAVLERLLALLPKNKVCCGSKRRTVESFLVCFFKPAPEATWRRRAKVRRRGRAAIFFRVANPSFLTSSGEINEKTWCTLPTKGGKV